MIQQATTLPRAIQIPLDEVTLQGDLSLPNDAKGIVIFAHGSGSSRRSPRNQFVASELTRAGLATLLFDLLTIEEEEIDEYTAAMRFNINLLADRLVGATDWVLAQKETTGLAVGYFGASTGGAAALVAAARRPEIAKAVVSRGGRPDLAGHALPLVGAPTLLIVGGEDLPVIEMNREAMALLRCEKRLEIVPGATHLFEEPGTLEEVARLARAWFEERLLPARPAPAVTQG
ncbi:MAG TPA: dienelactone hydrolase family protein [Tepidisphaeraceae bacterium]|nr:dienelactone hydrolase family protein [Tepidisphaeraceae bacterium]